ncbi:hypothetical protein BKP56_07070 [Marinilactibacillus sp. 15R]|uniref:hypothetical protein n=1 Tax=Marinilactibacillus sp. 15R TaxID=1911586 RepID=UPI00090AE424|nr:hypothetical protein [Marinilactibacillus sp. 15R]API89029.1 hypothetical protein BKP56_07070 [Marinilactibacillus sp. 15R]
MKLKYHYYRSTIRPDLPGIVVYYNYTTGLLALKEKHDVGQYLGYMTEEEADSLLERSKHGRRKMSSVNQLRGSR